jgi:hypothetical protein
MNQLPNNSDIKTMEEVKENNNENRLKKTQSINFKNTVFINGDDPQNNRSLRRSDIYSPAWQSNIRIENKLSDVLKNKKIIFEHSFDKNFKMVTNSVDFRSGLFYSECKIILESKRIVVIPANKNNMKKEKDADLIESYHPLLALDFDQVTATLALKPKSNKFRILVLGYDGCFKFRVTNKDIYESVLMHLNYYMNNSLGSKSNLFGVSLRKDFYKVTFNCYLLYRIITYLKETLQKRPKLVTS